MFKYIAKDQKGESTGTIIIDFFDGVPINTGTAGGTTSSGSFDQTQQQNTQTDSPKTGNFTQAEQTQQVQDLNPFTEKIQFNILENRRRADYLLFKTLLLISEFNAATDNIPLYSSFGSTNLSIFETSPNACTQTQEPLFFGKKQNFNSRTPDTQPEYVPSGNVGTQNRNSNLSNSPVTQDRTQSSRGARSSSRRPIFRQSPQQ